MKRFLLVLALGSTWGSAWAVDCFKVTPATMGSLSEKLVAICKSDYGITSDYNGIHAFVESVRNGDGYATACFSSCRAGENPSACAGRFIDDFAKAAVQSIRDNGKLEQLCTENKKLKSKK